MDRQTWATALVERFRPDPTPAGVDAVERWTLAEGGAGPQWGIAGNLAAFNPLNNTLTMPGSTPTPGNVPPVQAYTSWAEGLDATEAVIRQPNMAPIQRALEAGASCRELSAAVAASPWGTGSFAGLCPDLPPPVAQPSEDAVMAAIETTDAQGRKVILVYARGAGARDGHVLEFRRLVDDETANDVQDVTVAIQTHQGAGDPAYTVTGGL